METTTQNLAELQAKADKTAQEPDQRATVGSGIVALDAALGRLGTAAVHLADRLTPVMHEANVPTAPGEIEAVARDLPPHVFALFELAARIDVESERLHRLIQHLAL